MNIGTPLSDSATRVMLLGAGELGKEVIIALQRLGVETLAVDRYDNAPGHQVAHRALHHRHDRWLCPARAHRSGKTHAGGTGDRGHRHDTGMVTMASQWQNEFELHARAILGLPVDTGLREPGASAVIYGGLEASGIHFDNIAKALRLFGKPASFPRWRMGVALARGENIEQARERARQTAVRISPGK